MPTKLALQAFHVNQLIAQVICPFHYVSWDYRKLEWKYENVGFRSIWPYYIALTFIIFNIIIFVATIPFLLSKSSDLGENRAYKNAIVAGLLVIVMFLFLLVDYLFIVNGREWVYATNWMYHQERTPQTKNEYNLANRFSVRHILDILGMIFAGKIINFSNN